MNDVQIFSFENNQVRVIEIEGEPWFVGNDVATVLGYARPTKAIHDHVDQEDRCEQIVTISQSSQNGTPQKMLIAKIRIQSQFATVLLEVILIKPSSTNPGFIA